VWVVSLSDVAASPTRVLSEVSAYVESTSVKDNKPDEPDELLREDIVVSGEGRLKSEELEDEDEDDVVCPVIVR
jgi:hypothetical protein